jgi:hypothetical protein
MPALSEERLAKLAEARKKALEKRRILGDLSRKEKAVREKMLQDRITAADAALSTDTKMVDAVSAPTSKSAKKKVMNNKKMKNTVVLPASSSDEDTSDEGSSDDESEEEGEEEEEAEAKGSSHKRKKPPAVQKKKYRPSDSNRGKTNNELTAAIAREELQRRVQQENYDLAFRSVFPCHRLY